MLMSQVENDSMTMFAMHYDHPNPAVRTYRGLPAGRQCLCWAYEEKPISKLDNE